MTVVCSFVLVVRCPLVHNAFPCVKELWGKFWGIPQRHPKMSAHKQLSVWPPP